MSLFKQCFIWERINSKTACRYACLENIQTQLHYIQSADYFDLPVNSDDFKFHNNQFVELFVEEDISTRTSGHKSITEAIAVFKHDFEHN